MENKLTNEEIAKVFAMYLACECERAGVNLKRLRSIPYLFDEYHAEFGNNEAYELGEVKLLLKPLSSITDEDAIEVCDTFFRKKGQFKTSKVDIEDGKRIAFQVCNNEPFFNYIIYPFVYQYLISRSYAVPLFFAPNHWANGKTAIELNIAIEQQ